MKYMMLSLCAATVLAATPLLAQDIDFGTDSSQWSNDGECDDPRFRGPGMTTTTLLDADIRADATDCRSAYEAGQITLAEAPAPAAAPQQPPAKPGAQTPAPVPPVPPASDGGINFGDDSGEWANDRECDDRRFAGAGMAANLSWGHVGADASDCRIGVERGALVLWDMAAARAVTQCATIDFGDDSGGFPDDRECDDVRFEGMSMAWALNVENLRRDATDCRRACDLGLIALRDY